MGKLGRSDRQAELRQTLEAFLDFLRRSDPGTVYRINKYRITVLSDEQLHIKMSDTALLEEVGEVL